MKKKRRIKKSIKICFIFIILIALTIVSYWIINKNGGKDFNFNKFVNENKITYPIVNKISLVATGDALLHNPVYISAYDNSTESFNFAPQLELVKEEIKNYDIKYYNQETSISGSQFAYLGYDCYNTPSEFGLDMIDTGFNMISLANNHTFDGELGVVNGHRYCYKSELGASNSVKFWNKQKDVYTSGSYLNQKERDNIVIKKKNGITYTLLSYTYGLNIPEGYEESPYLVNIYSDEQAKKDIEKVRNKVDVIFVSMHWGEGNELGITPNEEQKRQAKYLASLGVDIIIGHHPYGIQPIEKINNTLVFYSLGRIISSKTYEYGDYLYVIGLLSELTITKKNNKIKIENTNNELIYNYYDENYKNNEIIPFSEMNTNYNKDYIRLYEKYSKIVRSYDNNVIINNIK